MSGPKVKKIPPPESILRFRNSLGDLRQQVILLLRVYFYTPTAGLNEDGQREAQSLLRTYNAVMGERENYKSGIMEWHEVQQFLNTAGVDNLSEIWDVFYRCNQLLQNVLDCLNSQQSAK
jgi:hypothetical protein